MIKKILKIFAGILLAVIILLIAYIAYLYLSYHRIPDNQALTVETPAASNNKNDNDSNNSNNSSSKENNHDNTSNTSTSDASELKINQEYSAVTYNLGFGAYTPDFSFFMDGGKSSWAKSKKSVIETIQGAGDLTKSLEPDFILFQEVDLNSTRSYHVNEYQLLKDTFSDYTSVFAQNYDSAFLFYPFYQPHGKSQSGLALFSKYPITDSVRRSLPIATSFQKFLDLDRCYSISKIPVENGKELVIFELHASAYGNSDKIREGQISMLCSDMQKEYENGNYVLCGGDFNHDLKASEDSSDTCESWAYPFPRSALPDHFSFGIDSLSKTEIDKMWNSSRNADTEYIPEKTYTVTLDGFILSDNLECTFYENVNTGYTYSDHDPVYLTFKLK